MLELENSRSAGGDAPAHNARENKGERGLNSSISYIYALLYYLLSRYLIIIDLINTAACMLNSVFRQSIHRIPSDLLGLGGAEHEAPPHSSLYDSTLQWQLGHIDLETLRQFYLPRVWTLSEF